MTKLYQVCSVCNGSGRIMAVSNTDPPGTLPTDRPCPVCRPLRVVETGLSASQAERAVRERDEYRAKLEELAGHCSEAMREYGLAYPKSCRACGLGPCQRKKHAERGGRTEVASPAPTTGEVPPYRLVEHLRDGREPIDGEFDTLAEARERGRRYATIPFVASVEIYDGEGRFVETVRPQ